MTEKQLWNSILQMAVTGKLVPQHPEDEPASALLARIEKEKATLIKEKKIKKEKNPTRIVRGETGGFFEIPVVEHSGRSEMGNGKWEMDGAIDISDQIPFEIPESWEWAMVGDFFSAISGLSYKKENLAIKSDSMVRILRGGNIGESDYKLKSDDVFISRKFVKPGLELKTGCMITPAVTSLDNIGKIGLIDKDYNDIVAGGFVLVLLPFFKDILLSKYLLYAFTTKYHRDNCRKITHKSGQAFYNLSREKLLKLRIPIPPRAEMERIVEKLGKLAPLVSLYGEKERAVSEMDANFAGALKKSVLAAAVSGKLLAQDAADEPAAALLARIEAEKAALIQAKKLKKEKNPTRIVRGKNGGFFEVSLSRHSGRSEMGNGKWEMDGAIDISDQLPFEIPESWEWVRLGNIVSIINGDRGKNYPAKSSLSKTGIPFISAVNLDGQTVKQDENLLCVSDEQYNRLGSGKLQKGDVVVCIRGSLGKHGRYPFEKGAIASSLVILRPFEENDILCEYIMQWIDSPLFFKEIKAYDNGTAQPNLAAKSLEKFFVPLPPLVEQERIAARVREIFATLDELH